MPIPLSLIHISKLNSREANFEKEKEKVAELRQSHLRELEKISGLTSEQAKEYLLKTVEEDVKHETAVLVKELERQAKDEANKKAKDYVVTAIQKCAAAVSYTHLFFVAASYQFTGRKWCIFPYNAGKCPFALRHNVSFHKNVSPFIIYWFINHKLS